MIQKAPSETELGSLIEDMNCLMQFLESVVPNDELLEPSRSALSQFYSALRACFQWGILHDLHDEEQWTGLAKDQKAFTPALEQVLARIRSYMHARYGVVDYRPTKKAKRDAEIYHRHNRGEDFTSLGPEFDISRTTAQAA